MSDADCTPGREPRSVAASFFLHFFWKRTLDRCRTCNFVARLWRLHRTEQPFIPKTSRATVRRVMTQRATRPVTLATLTRHPRRATWLQV